MGVIGKLLAMNPTEYLDLTEPNTRRCGTCHTRKRISAFDSDECQECESRRERTSKAADRRRAVVLAGYECARFDTVFPEPAEVKHNRLTLLAQQAAMFGEAHPRWRRAMFPVVEFELVEG